MKGTQHVGQGFAHLLSIHFLFVSLNKTMVQLQVRYNLYKASKYIKGNWANCIAAVCRCVHGSVDSSGRSCN